MKWLALALVVLVLALAGFPATVGAVGTLIGYRADNAQAISYISRDIHAMDASRHRAKFRRKLDRLAARQRI
jgi:hypothetical protein